MGRGLRTPERRRDRRNHVDTLEPTAPMDIEGGWDRGVCVDELGVEAKTRRRRQNVLALEARHLDFVSVTTGNPEDPRVPRLEGLRPALQKKTTAFGAPDEFDEAGLFGGLRQKIGHETRRYGRGMRPEECQYLSGRASRMANEPNERRRRDVEMIRAGNMGDDSALTIHELGFVLRH